MKVEVKFPTPIRKDNRLFFARSEIEHYKRQVVAEAHHLAMPTYSRPDIETFVPAPIIADEMGMSRRTLGRKIKAVEDLITDAKKAG